MISSQRSDLRSTAGERWSHPAVDPRPLSRYTERTLICCAAIVKGELVTKLRRPMLIVLLSILLVIPIGIYYGIGPALSCDFPARGPIKDGLSARTLISSGVERCYLLYAPAGYEPTKPIPVVFSLHGFAGNPQGLRKMSGWEEVADRESFLVIFRVQ